MTEQAVLGKFSDYYTNQVFFGPEPETASLCPSVWNTDAAAVRMAA